MNLTKQTKQNFSVSKSVFHFISQALILSLLIFISLATSNVVIAETQSKYILGSDQNFMDQEEIQEILIDMSEDNTLTDYYLPNTKNIKDSAKDNNIVIPALGNVIPKDLRDSIDKKRKQQASALNKEGVNKATKITFPATLPQTVDLRIRDTKIKSQFGGTCTAFGLMAAVENFIVGRFNIPPEDKDLVNLSERHFWSLYSKTSVSSAMTASKKYYVTEEKYWPQSNKKPYTGYKNHAHTKLLSSVYIVDDVTKALEALARGNPVYIGMTVSKGMSSCATVVTPLSAKTSGGHALAIVGYQLNESIQGGGYFIIKNSWGSKCGDNGYQYIPFYHCARSGMYCIMWEITGVETKFDS
ncbi:MAG: C1 family peptidase [Oligoflexia bacterium]|nr:C1 family peptidase [Oligoflexia bacterium]